MDQNLQTAATVSSLGLDKQTSPTSSGIPVGGHEKKVGPIIAVLIIVLVLIIASLYLFASRISQPTLPDDGTTAATAADDQSAAAGVQPVTSNSTDVNSMQNDLDNSTNGLDNQNF